MSIFRKKEHIITAEKNLMSTVQSTLIHEREEQEEYPVIERDIFPAKVICPDCGGLTTEGRVFCELCGGELETMEEEKI